MAGSGKENAIHLPKGWPRRVRSAVIHAVSIANVVSTATRSRAENHFNARVRLQAENDRLRSEVSLLQEELRIKDSRMERLPAQRRPHYPPVERLAILELRAARGWSQAQTARRLLVTPLTVASWTKRLDDEGPDALVQLREPVNRFPEFVGYLVRRLKVLCPAMGTRRIARVLARAGLHLGATTVRRMLRRRDSAFRQELSLYAGWYNGERPHSRLAGRTPDEVYFGRFPACRRPRFEPRSRWPRPSPCARPNTLVRGRPGATIELDLSYRAGWKHLPVVELKRVA